MRLPLKVASKMGTGAISKNVSFSLFKKVRTRDLPSYLTDGYLLTRIE